ncbi:MAG: cytochrome c oxidase assembly protein [Gemmatimonadaceae bacterium]|nr:cytochrome c oxidase assembly protein [Gemmatimonadaceae bacterium]
MTRRLVGLVAASTLCLLPNAAYAHPGAALEPHDLWRAWSAAPGVLLGCLVAVALYARGVRVIRRRAGTRLVSPWRVRSFAAAIAALLIALVSPLDALAGSLFSAHMVQHLLLMMVAAPLLVLGDPMTAMLWALPPRGRRGVGLWWRRRRTLRAVWRAIASPGGAWILHVVALWIWHVPALYDRAVADGAVHVLEHLAFLGTALLFWWVPFKAHGRRVGGGTALIYLFGAVLQGTILGALLALARLPLYTAHFGTTRAWGLTPLEDQQLAGLLMWVPAGFVYLAALVPLALRVLRQPPGQGVRVLATAGVSARGTP